MSDGAENEKIEPPVGKKVHKSDDKEPRNQIAAKETAEEGDRPSRKSASKTVDKLKNIKEEKLDPNDTDFEGEEEYDENDDIVEDDGEVTSEHSDVKSEEFDLEDYLKFREADKEEAPNGGGAREEVEEEDEEEEEEEEEEVKPKKGKKQEAAPAKKKKTFDFDEDPK